MKEKVMIYPFDRKSYPIVKYEDLLKNFSILSLVSPEGWICSEVLSIKRKEIKVCHDFKTQMNKCTLLWIVDSELELSVEKFIIPIIVEAIKQNKKILLSRLVNKKERKKILSLIPTQNLYLTESIELYSHSKNIIKYYDIEVPVIAVCGTYPNLNKFEIQLELRKNFIEKGYKVLQIGSRRICEAFGFYSMPDFMFDEKYSEKEKILNFNCFLKQKELDESPDVIILGIPGGLVNFSRKVISDFGVWAFEITQTVIPDFTILNVPFSEGNDSYLEVSRQIGRKYNMFTDIFVVSERTIDVTESSTANKIVYLNLDRTFISKNLESLPYQKLIGISESNDKIVDKIITQFRKYGSVKMI